MSGMYLFSLWSGIIFSLFGCGVSNFRSVYLSCRLPFHYFGDGVSFFFNLICSQFHMESFGSLFYLPEGPFYPFLPAVYWVGG